MKRLKIKKMKGVKIMKSGMLVKVYDGDLVKWTLGTLMEKYPSSSKAFEKWNIKCIDGTNLIRYIKSKYSSFKEDGCGYLLTKDFTVKAKINFNVWDVNQFAESWDDPEYFKSIFLNTKNEVYEMKWDGEEFFELINVTDERDGTLFGIKDLLII